MIEINDYNYFKNHRNIFAMFNDVEIEQKLLNESEGVISENSDKRKSQLVYCQLCGSSKMSKHMFSVSQKCQGSHIFCFECLIARLSNCIDNNQDCYCPIDYCPESISQDSQLFKRLPNSLHNKYVKWKTSKEYLQRNKSYRESILRLSIKDQKKVNQKLGKRDDLDGLIDVGYFFNELDPNQRQERQQPRYKQLKREENIVERRSKKKRERKPKEVRKRQPENQVQVQEKMNQLVMEQKQIKVNPGAALKFSNNMQRQNQRQLVEIAFTLKIFVVKAFFLVFGLPFMFLAMAFLIIFMFFVYLFWGITFLGTLGCLAASGYFLIVAITSYDKNLKGDNFFYSFSSLFVCLICFIFTRFLLNNFNQINYLVIKNSWIWWIKGLLLIWSYPYQTPVFYLGPRRLGKHKN